jgi:tripartite-type tricarboxylate transporter receptor subunit TctC
VIDSQSREEIMRKFARLVLWAGALLAAGPGLAQDNFPTKPIRLLVGLGPGSGSDVLARVIAQKISEDWKQGVIVDNRTGAGGIVASEMLAHSLPDGYTLGIVGLPTHAFQAAYYSKLPYDTLKDFAGITMVADMPQVLVVSPLLRIKSMRELIELAKSKPGQMNFASVGIGMAAHTVAEQFNLAAGIEVVHVPFKGMVEALTALIGGNVQYVFASVTSVVALVKSGKLVALAVSSKNRSPALPDVPAMSDVGMPGFDFTTVYGLLVPAKTPKVLKDKLALEIVRVLARPDVTQSLLAQGGTARTSTPEEFDQFIQQEFTRMVKLIKAVGIKPE